MEVCASSNCSLSPLTLNLHPDYIGKLLYPQAINSATTAKVTAQTCKTYKHTSTAPKDVFLKITPQNTSNR